MSLSPAAARIAKTFCDSIEKRRSFQEPYQYFLLDDLMPADVAVQLRDVALPAPSLDGVSGKRELHNDTRSYFDTANMAKFPVMRDFADACQSQEVVQAIAKGLGAPIDDTFVRLEYAMDVDGFWLEPHTDLGVKKFTCLIYLSDDQEDLGTDIYRGVGDHFGRPPFVPNTAMIFVPAENTWHGFEKRPINGVRKSVILNYVTHEWRAREQLSFTETVRV
jgi:hypothetical protein